MNDTPRNSYINPDNFHGKEPMISDRDWTILQTVDVLGAVTGIQIQRLHFHEMKPDSAFTVRRRVLRRLVSQKILLAYPRRIAGYLHGSGQYVYAVGSQGAAILRQQHNLRGATGPVTRSRPGQHMLPHTLDISDIYVQLTELSRTAEFRVEEFATEPASWWRDVDEGIIKPDAFAMVAKARRLNMWWIEVERGREPVSVVVKQLGIYLRFAWHGRPGPHEVIPRVLVTVPSTTRRRALTRAIDRLDDPAPRLIKVALHADAAGVVAQVLEDAVRRSDDDTADT